MLVRRGTVIFMQWSEDMLETLDRMWDEGHTCSVIGAKLGVTANAVAGKAHRRKLPMRLSPIKGDGPDMQKRREASKRATIVRKRAELGLPPPVVRPRKKVVAPFVPAIWVAPLPPPVTCSWPLGEPKTKGFRFCDAKPVAGRPYCAEHCQRAYIGFRSRREAA